MRYLWYFGSFYYFLINPVILVLKYTKNYKVAFKLFKIFSTFQTTDNNLAREKCFLNHQKRELY